MLGRESQHREIIENNEVSGKGSLKHIKVKSKSIPGKGNSYVKGLKVLLAQLSYLQWVRDWNGDDEGGRGTS